jgi:broad specificity phosphatase PhoE
MLAQVAERADRVLARVRPLLQAGEDVALVGHGHDLRVLAARWLGCEPQAGAHLALSAGSVSGLGYEHDRPVILYWNLSSALLSESGHRGVVDRLAQHGPEGA